MRISTIVLLFIISTSTFLTFTVQPGGSEPFTWIVDDDGPANFSSVQEAINSPIVAEGDIIFVHSGTYYESIELNKTVSLVGEDMDTTILNGGGASAVVSVTADNSRVDGFTITAGSTGIKISYSYEGIASRNLIVGNHITNVGLGIYVEDGSSNNTISMNTIEPNWIGIELGHTGNNTLFGNSITGNDAYYGIYCVSASNSSISKNRIRNFRYGINFYGGAAMWGIGENNVLMENDIANCDYGIYFDGCWNNEITGNTVSAIQENGISLVASAGSHYYYVPSTNNTVSQNNITSSHYGILIAGSWNNDVVNNSIEDNVYGVSLCWIDNFINYEYSHDNRIIRNNIIENTLCGIELNSSFDNLIYYNNFLNNIGQVHSENSTNEWDNGYPSGGNYWSDYTDTDTYHGPYQNETGGDGTWDHPYMIDANNQDHYPFTNPWHAAPIVSLSQTPDYPLPAQKVKIYAHVIESSGADGVETVFFSYRANGGPWWNTTMIFNATLSLYETTVLGYEKHDFIEYFVKAVDNAGNTKTTLTYHYEVLRCDANHNGVIDVYDIYMIGKAWESSIGEPRYIFDADIDENCIVDAQDLCLVNLQYGKGP